MEEDEEEVALGPAKAGSHTYAAAAAAAAATSDKPQQQQQQRTRPHISVVPKASRLSRHVSVASPSDGSGLAGLDITRASSRSPGKASGGGSGSGSYTSRRQSTTPPPGASTAMGDSAEVALRDLADVMLAAPTDGDGAGATNESGAGIPGSSSGAAGGSGSSPQRRGSVLPPGAGAPAPGAPLKTLAAYLNPNALNASVLAPDFSMAGVGLVESRAPWEWDDDGEDDDDEDAGGPGESLVAVAMRPLVRLRTTVSKTWRHMKHPFSWESLWWNVLVYMFVLWAIMSLPVRLAFRRLWTYQLSPWYAVDYIGDIVFLADMWLRWRSYYYDDGLYVTTAPECKKHYLRTWFVVDLLSVIPVDVFFVGSMWKHAAARLNRCIRALHSSEYWGLWELHSHRSSQRIRFGKLVLALFVLIHVMACLVWVFSYGKGFGGDSWLPPASILTRSVWDQYVFAIFFSGNTWTRVGGTAPYPQATDEKVLVSVYSFVVLFVTSAIVGSIVGVLAQLNQDGATFRNKMQQVNQFMERRNVPHDLRKRVRNFFFHLWSREGSRSDSSLLDQLPPRLKTDVALEINNELSRVHIFNNAVPGFLNALVHVLKPEIYAPGDVIIQDGDIGRHMYFVKKGSLEVRVRDVIVATLGPGDAFGEVALLIDDAKRTATIQAVTFCDVYSLSKGNLSEVLKDFPEQRRLLRKVADKRRGITSILEGMADNVVLTHVPNLVLNSLANSFAVVADVVEPSLLFEPTQAATSIYYVGSGEVQLLDADMQLAKKVGSREFFGSLDEKPYTRFGVIDADSVVFELNLSTFRQFLRLHVAPEDESALQIFVTQGCRRAMLEMPTTGQRQARSLGSLTQGFTPFEAKQRVTGRPSRETAPEAKGPGMPLRRTSLATSSGGTSVVHRSDGTDSRKRSDPGLVRRVMESAMGPGAAFVGRERGIRATRLAEIMFKHQDESLGMGSLQRPDIIAAALHVQSMLADLTAELVTRAGVGSGHLSSDVGPGSGGSGAGSGSGSGGGGGGGGSGGGDTPTLAQSASSLPTGRRVSFG